MQLRLIISFFILVLSGVAKAQITFNQIHHHQTMLPTQGGRSVFEQPDGYLLFNVQPAADSSTTALFVSKFDLDGNFMWETQYHTPGYNTGPGYMDPVTPTSDGGYSAALTLFSGSLPYRTYLYHFNVDGDTLWTRFIKEDTVSIANHGTTDLTLLNDGGYIHSGWCNVPGYGGCVTRLDSAGIILWEKIHPLSDQIFSATETWDGGFILGTRNSGYPDRGAIVKTDDQGEQQWRRNFGGHAIASGGRPIQIPDLDYLVPSAWASTDSFVGSQSQFASLYKYSPTGVQLWRKDYFYGSQAMCTHIKPAGSDLYWLVGGRENYPAGSTHVLKIDSEGDSLWMRKYHYYSGAYSYSVPYGIEPTSDGGLVMTGIAQQGTTDPQPFHTSNWLIKLDEHGCLVPGCHLIDDTGLSDHVLGLNQYFSIWPNPVAGSGRLEVSFEPPPEFAASGKFRLVLLDALGRTVHDEPWPASDALRAEMHLSGLSPGLYHIHLTDERSWLAGGKVVVE